MLKQKLYIPVFLFIAVGTIAAAINQAEGDPTSMIAFLFIGLLSLFLYIPVKHKK
ncbi:MAG TPA: hypothetical protein VHK69_19870 [Chitinophagaceae bacterium]|jgi:hypothetical protein|nr:hypothetical protein [Chitinophagaceae bacterium]